ncbi:MYND-type domain-containing protein [Mycena chlorophos]|uniref:MYND-type domain-containing protein n=1 Tax=Mycena chlorophos TaxID=658473 RepID=A0A8H6TMQ7_MYCCL|nr:MYND-type domain-containing protein [Mycena chlorophos]
MHPCLDLALVENLPEPYKTRTQAALAGNGSREQISAGITDCVSKMPKSRIPFLIPAVFTLLDPVHIDASVLELSLSVDLPDAILDRIDGISPLFAALAYLVDGHFIPVEAFELIWPRVWAWIEFIQKFAARFPPDAEEMLFEFYRRGTECVSSLRKQSTYQEKYERMICHTPGVYRFIGTVWSSILCNGDPVSGRDQIKARSAISVFFALESEYLADNLDGRRDEKMQELKTGAGGTWEQLAALVVKHLELSIPTPESDVLDVQMGDSTAVIPLLRNAVDHPECRIELARAGVVKALVVACRAYNRSFPTIKQRGAPFVHIPEQFTKLLMGHLATLRAQERVVEGLQAGLLRLIVEYGSRFATSDLESTVMRVILGQILMECTVFYSVLVQLRISFPEIAEVAPSHFDAAPEIAQVWKLGKSGLRWSRIALQVLERYETGELTKLRACDNLKWVPRHPYLPRIATGVPGSGPVPSPKGGAHKRACPILRSRREGEFRHVSEQDTEISRDDRAFLRALVNHEYEKYKGPIVLGHVGILSLVPPRRPSVIFDFTRGKCEIEVIPVLDASADEMQDVRFEALRRQQGAAGGVGDLERIEMHVVGIQMGRHKDAGECMVGAPWWIPMPLRSSSPEMAHAIRALAATVPRRDTSMQDLTEGFDHNCLIRSGIEKR